MQWISFGIRSVISCGYFCSYWWTTLFLCDTHRVELTWIVGSMVVNRKITNNVDLSIGHNSRLQGEWSECCTSVTLREY